MFQYLKQLCFYYLISVIFNDIIFEVIVTFSAKVGIVLIFIVPLVPEREIAAIALLCISNIGAPTPYT